MESRQDKTREVGELLAGYIQSQVARMRASSYTKNTSTKLVLFLDVQSRLEKVTKESELKSIMQEIALIASQKRSVGLGEPDSWTVWRGLSSAIEKIDEQQYVDTYKKTLNKSWYITLPDNAVVSNFDDYLEVKKEQAKRLAQQPADHVEQIVRKMAFQYYEDNPLMGVTSLHPCKVLVHPRPFLYGKEIYTQMGKLILDAKNEVLIKQYKIEDNATWQYLLSMLESLSAQCKLQGKKVQVKILVNKPSGGASYIKGFKSKAALDRLKRENFEGLDIAIGCSQTYGFDSQHSKFVIVDKQRALVSTTDPYKENDYIHKTNEKGQYENAMLIEGDVADIRDHFIVVWNDTKTLKEGNSLAISFEKSPSLSKTNDFVSEALFLGKNAYDISTLTQPPNMPPAKIAMLHLIKNQVWPIVLVSPNFNDPELRDAVREAAIAGCEIQIFLPKYRNDKEENKKFLWTSIGGDNVMHMNLLMDQVKARCHGKIPENLKLYWVKDEHGHHGTYYQMFGKNSHVKFLRAGDYFITGSTNLDTQSTQRSEEADYLIHDSQLAESYTKIITAEYLNNEHCFLYQDELENLKADILNELDNIRNTKNYAAYLTAEKDVILAHMIPIDVAKDIRTIDELLENLEQENDKLKNQELANLIKVQRSKIASSQASILEQHLEGPVRKLQENISMVVKEDYQQNEQETKIGQGNQQKGVE